MIEVQVQKDNQSVTSVAKLIGGCEVFSRWHKDMATRRHGHVLMLIRDTGDISSHRKLDFDFGYSGDEESWFDT